MLVSVVPSRERKVSTHRCVRALAAVLARDLAVAALTTLGGSGDGDGERGDDEEGLWEHDID